MEASEREDDFLAGGFAALGIEADETEMAVARAAHDLFWPAILDLLARDFGEAPPEPGVDLSRGPR